MLRIGLLVSSPISSKYVYEFALWAREQRDLQIVALVVGGQPENMGSFARLLWAPILALERRLLGRSRHYRDHYKTFDLSELAPDPIPAEAGPLAAARLDVLVTLHPVAFDPRLVEAARLGLIGFDVIPRGVPTGPTLFGSAGFWPCHRRSPRTPFAIRRLGAPGMEPEICVSGAFATEWYFSLNQASLLTKATLYLRDVLKRLAAGAPAFAASVSDNVPPENAVPPRVAATIAYGLKFVWRELRRLRIRFLRLESRWSVSVGSGTLESLDPSRLTAIPSPPGKFWADPFLWSRGGKTYCYLEELPFSTARGHISALELRPDGVVDLGPALIEDFHLSFPFLFEFEGRLFMIPESGEVRQIRLYVCEDFPRSWRLHSVLVENVAAADTMVFPHGERWWLMTSLDRAGVGDHCSELNLFSADSPLSKEWTPHPNNPIRIDSFGGRNAGMLARDRKLYRFGQRQGFDQYGEGLMIFRVDILTPDDYRETLVREISPSFGKGLIGVHHLSFHSGQVAIDHLRRERV